jgi:hypothetical protein
MEIFLSICLGVGLSAACGFRVFVPLLCLSVAAKFGFLPLTPAFAWVGTTPALIAFGAATVAEIAAYYIPWVDNALDTVAGPLATVAGVVVMASVLTDIEPFWRWTLAVIAGGGLAASTQLATTKARAASSLTTGGFANPVLATIENITSTVLSIFAVVWPVVALILVIGVLAVCGLVIWFVGKRLVKFFRAKPVSPTVTAQA